MWNCVLSVFIQIKSPYLIHCNIKPTLAFISSKCFDDCVPDTRIELKGHSEKQMLLVDKQGHCDTKRPEGPAGEL